MLQPRTVKLQPTGGGKKGGKKKGSQSPSVFPLMWPLDHASERQPTVM